MKLLFAEDEVGLSEAIVDILNYQGYYVDAVYDGNDALYYAQNQQYDGIILDVMMPGLSGFDVLERLRHSGCRTPVLLLTARAEVEDRIRGLDLGADDYLPKPFDTRELLARVRAMLRRREEYTPSVLVFGDIALDSSSFELRCGDRTVLLAKLEYRLMEVLILNQGIYLSSEDLLVKVWGYDTESDRGSVWVYISYLRKKLSGIGSRVKIRARRNVGYTLEMNA